MACTAALPLVATPVDAATQAAAPPAKPSRFALGRDDFLLDGQPYRVIGCELHPARIPPEYWRHRLRMVRAMGCNTVPIYMFWNHHEAEPGKFDFRSGSRNIAQFVRLAQQEGLLVLLRPGPYVCAEWDFGGLPPYLLRTPDIGVRGMDPRYMKAVERYVAAVAAEFAPLQIDRGGPIAMLQIENEYGSYANDRAYLARLAALWRRHGITVPFYTADGPSVSMLSAGTLPGAAVGLDSGSEDAHFELARKINPGVPVFSSETYPGWLTHWGEKWAQVPVDEVLKEVGYLLDGGRSFSFYVAHGGTNFGFTAGANSGGKGYEPDVTSYDYDAPIDEQGRPTPKFFKLRELIGRHAGQPLPELPPPVPVTTLPPVKLEPYASLWQRLPKPVRSAHPKSFDALGHEQGLMLYRTRLAGARGGKLVLNGLHDLASVYLDGRLIGHLDRRLGENSIELPAGDGSGEPPLLEVMVEAMGRINFADRLIDRKGITGHVTLAGMTLMNWEMFPLALKEDWVRKLPATPEAALDPRPGRFFRAHFDIGREPADTFLDLSAFGKGMVWVNGHNLGRYWNIGPQQRLYLPAPWLRRGRNEVVVLDLRETASGAVAGFERMND
ncbi:beta-galactosidase [Chitinimonas koreensis]|nr:beta-galactosidase [Chitinimonas koreensis]